MSKTKIILVEDDAIEAMDIKRTLESFGFEVPFVASRGEEAVEKSLDIMPDLVIMDIVLKGEMNRIEAAEEIVKLQIPVIYLSAHSDEPTVQKAKLTGPHGYIIKPYGPTELKYAIELALYKNKMEMDLRNSQRQLSAIIDGSPVLQFVIDKNHYVTHWNQAMADYSGIPSEEIIGTDEHWRAFYSEKRPCLADLIIDGDIKVLGKWYSGKYKESEHLKGAYVAEDFFPSIGENGNWLHFTAASIKDAEGNIIGALETLEDITERKVVENSLRINEERLKIALQGANAAVFDWYIPTGEAYFSPEYYQMFGYEADEFPANYDNWSKLIHVDDREKTLADLKKQIEDKLDNFKIEYRVICKDMSIKWILGVAKGFEFDENGFATRIIGMNQDITERKTIEERLKLTQFSVEHGPDSIIWITSDARICFVNEAACESLGYSNEELISMTVFDIDPDFPQEEWEEHWKDIKNGKIKTVETKHRKKNGERFYVNISINYLKYNEIEYNCAFIRDVTPQKEVEKSMKEQYHFLQNLIDTIPYPLFYKNKEYVYMGCNNAFEEFIGLSKDEIIGKTVYDISPKDLADKYHQKDKELFENQILQVYEAPVQYADGSQHIMLFNKATFEDKDGEPAGLIGVMADITERKRAEESLKYSEAEYRAIFENSKSAVSVYNAVDKGKNFVFKDFNKAAEQIEQIKREDVIGRLVTDIFPGVVEFGIFEVFQRVWKTGKPEKYPVSIYKDARIEGWRENYVYKLPSGDIVAVYDDLTEIKQYEEELEQNQIRLKSLVRILQYKAESVQDFLDYALKEAISLTESKLGYIYHYYEDRKEFVLNTWSNDVMNECTITEQQTIYKLDKTGVWGEAVRQRKPIVLNDFKEDNPLKKGYPEGHATLHRFMTIPISSSDKIVAVVGLANKDKDYTETDILQIELLMDSVWKVLDVQQAEDALKKSEARYKAIFENTGSAMAISEKDMTLSLVNDEFAQFTGYSKEKIENKMSWTNFFVEEELPKMKEYHQLRRIEPDKVPANYESRVMDIEGNIKDVYMSVAMIPGTKKSVVSLLDITEKKQSRIKLRKELEINRSLARIYVPIISPESKMEDITVAILKEARKLTKSKHGFVSSIDPKTNDNIAHSLSRMMRECEVMWDKNEVVSFHIGSDGLYPSLWGHCLNTKESFYTNNAEKHSSSKGAPEGHVEIEKFLGIPVLIDDEVAGEIALANPVNDYSDEDINVVERIAEFFAMAIQRKKYEDQIKKSLDEKVLLLREIHHRVKNNLQIISSILNLQSLVVKDKYLVDVFKQNRNRIKAMAMIHEKLYNAPDLAKIDFSDYIRSLTTDITYTYLVKTEFLDIKLDLEDNIMLNIETAIPCGLIFSELISNSIKHAFTEGVKGEIKIGFKKIDENFILTLSDNGIGLPDELDFRKTESLGFQLVNSLVEQLEGSIELDKTKGTKFIIKFKELKYKKRM